MPRPEPYVREAGAGPGVVCTHANASTSGQWRGLTDLLSPRFRVLAPDFYGSGKSPEWPSDRVISLHDEVALIEPVLANAGSPLILVGHSYGAAVALVAASDNPGRVRATAFYEPTLFALLDAEGPSPNEADGIRNAVEAASVALDAGNQDAAAEQFIDYWMGVGSWKATPESSALATTLIANLDYLMNDLKTLFRFKSWADTELLEALGAIDAASHPAELKTAIRTVNHLHVVDQIFRGHLQGVPHGFAATNTPHTPTLVELKQSVGTVDDWYVRYTDGLDEAQLVDEVQFTFTDSDTGRMTRQEILMHVLTHGGYHRGAVGQVLRSVGIAPPRELYTRFLHATEPQRRVRAS